MRTYVRAAKNAAARHGMRAICISIAALAAIGIVAPLSGCGSGKGPLRSVSITRKKGTVTMTVVWPARTRLIPAVANSIQVTLTRTPDTDIPSPKTVAPILLTRPESFDGSGTTTATFSDLELGTYTITATAYPAKTGPGVPNPTTGENVPVALKSAGNVVVGEGANNVGITMDSTIAVLEPSLDDTFPRDGAGNLNFRPGQAVQFNIVAYDAATAPRNRVLFTTSQLKYEVSSEAGADVSVSDTGLVTAVGLTDPSNSGTAVIRVTDQESGKFSEITVRVSPAGLSTAAQWSRFHGDSQNTGQVRDLNVPILDSVGRSSNGQNWPFITGSTIDFSSPTIAQDGTVYIGTITKVPASSGDKKFYAINPDGTLKWIFDDEGTLGDVEGSATLAQDGTIYIGSTNGRVYAIRDTPDATKGTPYTVLWKYPEAGSPAGSPIEASVAIGENNTVYVATTNNDTEVIGLNGYTGKPVKVKRAGDPPGSPSVDWRVSERSNGAVRSAPALSTDGSILYVTTDAGIVLALRTGINNTPGASRIWRANLNSGPIQAAPVVTKIGPFESVIVATLGGKVFALRSDSGAPTDGWPSTGYDAGAQVYSTPVVREDPVTKLAESVYVATFDNTSGTDDHKVVSLSASNGTQVWRTTAGLFSNGFTSSPVLSADGTALYIGNYDGAVYAVDADPLNTNLEHGLVQVTIGGATSDWKYQTPNSDPSQPTNNLDSSPAIDKQGHVYIGGFDGSVYSIGIGPAK